LHGNGPATLRRYVLGEWWQQPPSKETAAAGQREVVGWNNQPADLGHLTSIEEAISAV
jgi:hypothetical protein